MKNVGRPVLHPFRRTVGVSLEIPPTPLNKGGKWRFSCRTIGASIAALGLAYASSWGAGILRWPVSRGLVIEGEWYADSWGRFPLLDCLGMLVAMGLLPVLLEIHRGRALQAFGFRVPRHWFLWLPAAVGVGFLFVLHGRWSSSPRAFALPAEFRLFFAIYFLCVAVSEEVLFRGFLQARLKEGAGLFMALIVTSGLFVLWHGAGGNGVLWLTRFLFAVAVGLLYDRSQSLLPSVVAHWTVNMGFV